MVNEEIIGGLVSALSRGESLQKAMMTFYNAGYKKEEIEESAKAVYSQVGAQIASKTGSPQNIPKATPGKIQDKINLNKDGEKFPQKISSYGEEKQPKLSKIFGQTEKENKPLKPITPSSKMNILNKGAEPKPQVIIQKVSDYREAPPKQVSKVVTYLLVFLLIILLGILAVVFFFKDDLIKVFNNLGLS